jgi:radical SAM superfamily enzyme YgiQ (UPF0313 family)
MKVLLIAINAKYIHTNNAVRLLKANSDFDIKIMEYTIKDKLEDILQDINNYNPDVVGFSAYIWNIEHILKLLPNIQATIILGGPEVSYESQVFMAKEPNIDYIIKGQGELVFDQLLHAIESKKDVDSISNLSYRKGQVIHQTEIKEIKDLSSLKSPYYFEEDIPHIKHKIAYIESSRGCPYKCSYCLSSLEHSVRFFDIEQVQEAILYLMSKGSKTIKFLDRTFNANKKTLDLMNFIIDHWNQVSVFQFEITGDILDINLIKHLNTHAPKGLFRFEIGIQSINYETNYLVDRHQNTEKLFANIKEIQKANIIDLHLDLIAGLPKEDIQSFEHTFNQVFFLGALELQLGFLKMLRGTKIRREADKYHYKFHEKAPYEIIENDHLSKEDISDIKTVEHMLELYHNKGYFKDNMLQILLSKESPFQFLLQVGNDYIKQGHSFHGHQIEDVYKRIMPFLTKKEQTAILKDYLLRSKIKPKIFFDVIKDKSILHTIFENLPYSSNQLFKHSITLEDSDHYFLVLYEKQVSIPFIIQKDTLS